MSTPATGVAVVVMGVSGSGKTTIGRLLAAREWSDFVDADDLHADEARAKMTAGLALTDENREPWLARVAERIRAHASQHGRIVVACSALRRRYRDLLRELAGVPIAFVHLAGDSELLQRRLNDRSGHFMPTSLLPSQLSTLEPLGDDELGRVYYIGRPPEEIVAEVQDWLDRVTIEEAS